MANYVLAKIDLLNSSVFADTFDKEKYQIVASAEKVDDLIPIAISQFKKYNSQFNNWKDWKEEAKNGGCEIEIRRDYIPIFRASVLLLDPIIEKTLLLALRWHKDRRRKAGNDTDMVHLLQVANILRLQDRENPNKYLIASAFCHDLLEDTRCSEKEILDAGGSEVLRIVKACSNDSSLGSKTDWERKKIKYRDSVEAGGKMAMLLSLADKIANARSLIELYKEKGNDIWKSFNRGKDKKIWFEEMMFKMFDENIGKTNMLNEYRDLISKMKNLK